MTEFKEGDKVLVSAEFIGTGTGVSQWIAELRFNGHSDDDGNLNVPVENLIPVSALDVNKELLKAAKAAIAYCEEISTFGGKYGALFGAMVADARSIARGLNEAIASAEKGA